MVNVIEEQNTFFSFIDKEIKNNRLSHAYLIETNNYIYTDLVIKELLKRIIGYSQDNGLNIEKLIDDCTHPDISYIDVDGETIKRDQLKNVQRQFKEKSNYNGKQVYVIRDATKLNNISANTMLKFLEEPEENIIAILVADNRYKVIDTILSRCQVVTLKNEDKYEFDQNIVIFAENILDKSKGFLVYDEILETISNRGELSKKLKDVEQLLFYYVKKDQKKFLDYSRTSLIKIITILEDVIQRLEYYVNYKLVLDYLIVKVREVQNECC